MSNAKPTTPERSSFQHGPAYRYIRRADRLPTIDEARAMPDPMIRVKLFNPTGGHTWYIAAYDPETRHAWGLVDGQFAEVGDFDMAELVELRVGFGLPIERDLYWRPKPLSAVRK